MDQKKELGNHLDILKRIENHVKRKEDEGRQQIGTNNASPPS